MTPKQKELIDQMSYEQLLTAWRFAPVGDVRFQGESGKYWQERLCFLRDENPVGAVIASKRVGWK